VARVPSNAELWAELARLYVAEHCLASAAFFARDAGGVRIAAERVIVINPPNTGTVAVCGMCLAYSGAWDRRLDVIRQAMQPNPHCPG
jgi:hypothetical protein